MLEKIIEEKDETDHMMCLSSVIIRNKISLSTHSKDCSMWWI